MAKSGTETIQSGPRQEPPQPQILIQVEYVFYESNETTKIGSRQNSILPFMSINLERFQQSQTPLFQQNNVDIDKCIFRLKGAYGQVTCELHSILQVIQSFQQPKLQTSITQVVNYQIEKKDNVEVRKFSIQVVKVENASKTAQEDQTFSQSKASKGTSKHSPKNTTATVSEIQGFWKVTMTKENPPKVQKMELQSGETLVSFNEMVLVPSWRSLNDITKNEQIWTLLYKRLIALYGQYIKIVKQHQTFDTAQKDKLKNVVASDIAKVYKEPNGYSNNAVVVMNRLQLDLFIRMVYGQWPDCKPYESFQNKQANKIKEEQKAAHQEDTDEQINLSQRTQNDEDGNQGKEGPLSQDKGDYASPKYNHRQHTALAIDIRDMIEKKTEPIQIAERLYNSTQVKRYHQSVLREMKQLYRQEKEKFDILKLMKLHEADLADRNKKHARAQNRSSDVMVYLMELGMEIKQKGDSVIPRLQYDTKYDVSLQQILEQYPEDLRPSFQDVSLAASVVWDEFSVKCANLKLLIHFDPHAAVKQITPVKQTSVKEDCLQPDSVSKPIKIEKSEQKALPLVSKSEILQSQQANTPQTQLDRDQIVVISEDKENKPKDNLNYSIQNSEQAHMLKESSRKLDKQAKQQTPILSQNIIQDLRDQFQEQSQQVLQDKEENRVQIQKNKQPVKDQKKKPQERTYDDLSEDDKINYNRVKSKNPRLPNKKLMQYIDFLRDIPEALDDLEDTHQQKTTKKKKGSPKKKQQVKKQVQESRKMNEEKKGTRKQPKQAAQIQIDDEDEGQQQIEEIQSTTDSDQSGNVPLFTKLPQPDNQKTGSQEQVNPEGQKGKPKNYTKLLRSQVPPPEEHVMVESPQKILRKQQVKSVQSQDSGPNRNKSEEYSSDNKFPDFNYDDGHEGPKYKKAKAAPHQK